MTERTLYCGTHGVLRSDYVEQQREKHRRMRVLDKMRSTFDKSEFDAAVERPGTDGINNDSPAGMIRRTAENSWNFVFRMYHDMCERHAVPDAARHPFESGDALPMLATVTEMPITATSMYRGGGRVNAPPWYRDLRNWFAVYVFALARRGLRRVEDAKTFLFEEDDIETGWPSFLGIVWPADRSLRGCIDAATAAVQRHYAQNGEVWRHNPVVITRGWGQTEAQGITPASRLAAGHAGWRSRGLCGNGGGGGNLGQNGTRHTHTRGLHAVSVCACACGGKGRPAGRQSRGRGRLCQCLSCLGCLPGWIVCAAAHLCP